MVLMSTILWPQAVLARDFYIGREKQQEEITVQKGAAFTVVVEGKGWYLNRFDRGKLAFKKRTVEPDHTAFTMQSLMEGNSYMLFSFLSEDIYLPVRIEEYAAVEEREEGLLPDLSTGEGISSDQGVQEKTPVETLETAQRAGDSEGPVVEKDMYYINKENEIVMVPRRDENDLYSRGVALYNEKNYERAEKLFREYLSKCERCSYRNNVRILLAEMFKQSGRENEAVAQLDAVIESGKQSSAVSAYIMKADIYYKQGKIKEAAESYRKAYDMGEKDPGILEKIGDIYYIVKDYEKALSVYEEGIARGLKNDEILFRVASFYDQPGALRNIERAYYYYKLIVDRYPESKHYTQAEERVRFFEKYFFNYR